MRAHNLPWQTAVHSAVDRVLLLGIRAMFFLRPSKSQHEGHYALHTRMGNADMHSRTSECCRPRYVLTPPENRKKSVPLAQLDSNAPRRRSRMTDKSVRAGCALTSTRGHLSTAGPLVRLHHKY